MPHIGLIMKPCYTHLSNFITTIKENRKGKEESWSNDDKRFKKQKPQGIFHVILCSKEKADHRILPVAPKGLLGTKGGLCLDCSSLGLFGGQVVWVEKSSCKKMWKNHAASWAVNYSLNKTVGLA